MTIGRAGKKVVLATTAAGLLTLLFAQARAVDSEANERYTRDLYRLKELNARLNEDILKTRYGALTYYDPLMVHVAELKSIEGRLRETPSFVAERAAADISAAVDAHAELLRAKEVLLERFKSENAVLNNSARYLAVAGAEIAAGDASRGGRSDQLEALLRDVLTYMLGSNPELAQVIERRVVHIANQATAATAPPSPQQAVLVAHVKSILARKPRLEESTEALIQLPLSNAAYRVYALYAPALEEAQNAADIYRIGLYLCAVVLLGSALSIMRLRDSSAQLRLNNRALEEARNEALASTRAKSAFLANMSHEIRTPMNGVVGMAGLLLDTPLNAEQREFAGTIRSSAESLLKVINDILDFSRVESGRLEFESLDFNVRQVIEGPVELLAAQAEGKGIELACLIDADVPRQLRGDQGRLRQVLTNLLANAIKFTHIGEVVVRISAIENTADDVVLRVSVCDTGIGIPPSARAELFQAFAQADTSTTRKYGGTGLGLAISKQLVELMGGSIGCESSEGHGSTFWCTVRLQKPHTQSEHAPVPPLPARVLVVDDSATCREVVRRLLEAREIAVHEAGSGAEAQAALRDAAREGRPFEVVCVDVRMPDTEGVRLAAAIAGDPRLAGPRMLLMTGFQRRDGASWRQADIGAVVTKPVRESSLLAALASLAGDATAPLVEADNRPATSPHAAASIGTRPPVRVLVAEDNAVNRTVALHQLRKLGYAADAVVNGAEAVEVLGRVPYDIVLMDCQMPELDGYEATAAIRRREGTGRRVPIIAMTANALEGEREKCIAAGMDDYLTKPVDAPLLEKMLLQWGPAAVLEPASCDSMSPARVRAGAAAGV